MAAVDTPSSPRPSPHHQSPETIALKRRYLELLSPARVIDICLIFDPHVPKDILNSIWPSDLQAAVAVLQVLSRSPAAAAALQAAQASAAAGVKDSLPASTASAAGPLSAAQTLSTSTQNVTPTPPVASTPTATFPQQVPYGGFAAASTTYPHTTYFSTSTSAAAQAPQTQSYGSFTPSSVSFIPNTSAYGSASTSYASSFGYPSPSNALSTIPTRIALDPSHPNAHMALEDLPSYEEMIVEALEACTDPEGAPPKNLFMWMQAHYPLHTNFRPSASQALQKAFKRGRLGKTESGKYFINPNYQGSGQANNKRTRRPHSSTQPVVSGGQTSTFASPLPLQLRATSKHIPAGGQQQPYGLSTFVYGASGSGWGTTPPSQHTMTSTANLPVTAAPPPAPTTASEGTMPAETLAYLQQIIAEAQRAQAGGMGAEEDGTVTVPLADTAGQLSESDNAALQAQLTMLAAQLREIAEMEEDEEDGWGVEERHEEEEAPMPRPSPLTLVGVQTDLSDSTIPLPVVAKEEEEEEEGDDDDDEDMVEVEVPPFNVG